MIRRIPLFFIGLIFALSARAEESPRLVVLIVVDQMKSEYLDRYASLFQDGLAALLRDGGRWTGRHDHLPTETAPGHAAIATGVPPKNHGIVGNRWVDAASGKKIYCVFDKTHGIGPANLLAPTVADDLKRRDPEAIVVSVAGKDRSAVLMGGRAPDAVAWHDKKQRAFVAGSYGSGPGEWVQDFNRKHRRLLPRTDPSDAGTAALAIESLASWNLGADDHTDLLCVGFSELDVIGHRRGPDGRHVRGHLKKLDALLGDLLRAADKASSGRYAALLTSDHGIVSIPETAEGRKKGMRRVRLDHLRKTLRVKDIAPPHVTLSSGPARSERLASVKDALEKRDDVAAVYLGSDMAGDVPPQGAFAAELHRSFHPGRSGDLLVVFREGFMPGWEKGASHGTPYDDDALVPIIVYPRNGSGDKTSGIVSIRSVAPTLAVMLGLERRPEWLPPLIEPRSKTAF